MSLDSAAVVEKSTLPVAGSRATARVAWRLLWARPALLVVVVIASLCAGAAGLVAPIVLGRLVDVLPTTAGLDWSAQFQPVAIAAGLTVAAGLVGAVFTWIGMRATAQVGEHAVADLREKVVGRALQLDAAQVERAGTGDLVSRVAEDSRTVAAATSQLVPYLLSALTAVVTTSVGMVALDWRLGLVGLVAVPMYAASLRWYLPRSGPVYVAERAAFGERAGHLLGGITGARTLRAFHAEQIELDRINASSAKARDLSIGVFRLLTRLNGRNNRAEGVVLGLLLGAGFLFVWYDWITAGAVATAALLFHRLFNPLGALVVLFDEVQSAAASLSRMVGVVEAPVVERAAQIPEGRHGIVAKDLHHSYLAGQEVLHGVSLELAPDEVVAVVGSTGSGKTTLARIVAGIIPPSGGSCRLGGVEVSTAAEESLRRHISLVSQDVHTFSASLADNIRLARPQTPTDELWDALRRVRADGWVAALANGIETRVGDGGETLTPVQAQQIALARVLVADPGFVVLDEATAEAGSSGSKDLEAAAMAVLEDRGGLVVAHRLSQASTADRIIVLEHGAIVEQGSHDDLVAAGGRYAELWEAWSSVG